MAVLIELINGFMTGVFEIILWPFRGFDPTVALVVVSLLGGLLMLWVFAGVSNQEGISDSKDRIRGNLLGVRLFQHEIGVVLKLQGAIFRDLLRYLQHSFVPVLVLLIPVLLILVQLNLFFSNRPLQVGEQSILTLRLSSGSVMETPIELLPSEAWVVETAPVRVPVKQEVSWRIRAAKEGEHLIQLKVGSELIEKSITIGNRWAAVSPIRTSDSVDLFLYSGEEALSSESGLASVSLEYAALDLDVLGFQTDWLVLFFILSMVAAFAFKGFLGVEI